MPSPIHLACSLEDADKSFDGLSGDNNSISYVDCLISGYSYSLSESVADIAVRSSSREPIPPSLNLDAVAFAIVTAPRRMPVSCSMVRPMGKERGTRRPMGVASGTVVALVALWPPRITVVKPAVGPVRGEIGRLNRPVSLNLIHVYIKAKWLPTSVPNLVSPQRWRSLRLTSHSSFRKRDEDGRGVGGDQPR